MRRRLLFVPAALIILGACAWYWLLHTESGAFWIWSRAQSATGGALQAQQIQGDLGSGLKVQQLVFTTDSLTLHIEELRLVADLDLLPLQLQISEAVVDDTAVQINASDEEPQDNTPRKTFADFALPLSLVIEDVTANNISLSGLIADNDIVLTQVFLTGSWHEEIIIDRLLVDAIGPPARTGLSEAITLQLRADGNLEKLQIEVTSSPIEMSLQGSVANLLGPLSWDVQAQLAEANLGFGENGIEVHIENGHAASSGSLTEYSLTATALLDTHSIEPLQITTNGNGTTDSIDVSELSVRGADADLSGIGRIVWGDNWSIESQLGITMFNLGTIVEEWPSEHPIQGELSLLVDKNHLSISESYLAAKGTGMSVQVDGRIDLAASIVAGSVRWKDAEWPLAGDDPAISSKSGDISVDGSVDDWRINGDIEISTPTMPLGRLRVDGNGDRHHVEAAIMDSDVLGGNVSGFATFNWRDQQPWSAVLEISGIELSSIGDDWPGNVTGRIDADGLMSPFLLDLKLADIDAEFLGGPLSANGQVRLSDDRFTASDLKILHGDSRIELSGDPFTLSGLTFDVAVGDASRYLSEANGEFNATGIVSLHSEKPSLRIDASGAAFGYGEILAKGIEIVDQSGDRDVVDAMIKIERLDVRGDLFENVTVDLVADSAAQSLGLDASFGNADIHLLVAGQLDDLKHPRGWQGELRELGLAVQGEPIAELSSPTAIALSENAVTIDRGCIVADSGLSICAQADWSDDNYIDVDADLTDVPVDLINSFIETNLQFDQRVSGNFTWSQSGDSGASGGATFSLSAGTVVSDNYPDASIVTEIGLLSFDIANGQLLSGSAELAMPGFGHVAAQFSIPDIAGGANSDISGLIDIDLSDMGVLAALAPLIDDANGEFRAALALSGTLSEPQLVGDMAVVDGSLSSLPIGLQLDEINLTSLLHEDGQAELSGDFLAGDGRGEIVTRADYSATGATGFELELRGKNMTLIDAPNVTARADLDIKVNYDFRNLVLDGEVLVSHARVNPTNFAVSMDSESEDVVIVAGELPDDLLQQSREQETWITGSIGVELGDDVSVDLGPAAAKISGKTIFSWEENLLPIADGRYDLTGSIQAFGQVLEITEGGLRFPQVPADNPFIRIRAEREIYGNVQVKTAGVLVDGTLKQLAAEAYTRPGTTEERALTLLVTGSDFDFEQGLGAIDFGTYIAPRVFVSYGVGLFETENVIRIRYDLNRGFGITATSGEKETGIDLSYRIER